MSDISAVWTHAAESDAQHRARLNSILTRPAPAIEPPKKRPAAPVAQAHELPRQWLLIGAPLWQLGLFDAIEEHDSGDTAAPVTGQPAWLKPIPVKPPEKRRLKLAQLEAVLSVTYKERGNPEAYRSALAAVGKPSKKKPTPPKRKPKAEAVSAA